ncbi:molecular chaperone TorD family protein [Bradyrhizobium sp. NP1]|uniref:TorD/DmsD family molecular chaperone n=1 Tax=Bradyrhizobium sp. NP1 TaxID=3049772 RepID=UPI0025A63115|nr:molecular chaperone TorD family protein [Bradyrhizobium sp. NP1]WJR80313.1 molecular chaperone TorD family protein [Bradyrhizobium sp. NP1]
MVDIASQGLPGRSIDEIDGARAREYALLATLLSHSPDAQLLSTLAGVRSDTSPIGLAHAALAEAARRSVREGVAREYFALFAGLRDGALLPYASHYLADTLYGRPLARIRETLQRLGVEKAPERIEPEDHAGFLCEVMAGLVGGDISAPDGTDRAFFEEHLASWIGRFFVDLETTKSAHFYRSVGTLGRTFIEIEAHAFALSA